MGSNSTSVSIRESRASPAADGTPLADELGSLGQVRDVHGLYQTLSRMRDVVVLAPLCHQEYGQTEFVIRDPNGYVLVLAERD